MTPPPGMGRVSLAHETRACHLKPAGAAWATLNRRRSGDFRGPGGPASIFSLEGGKTPLRKAPAARGGCREACAPDLVRHPLTSPPHTPWQLPHAVNFQNILPGSPVSHPLLPHVQPDGGALSSPTHSHTLPSAIYTCISTPRTPTTHVFSCAETVAPAARCCPQQVACGRACPRQGGAGSAARPRALSTRGTCRFLFTDSKSLSQQKTTTQDVCWNSPSNGEAGPGCRLRHTRQVRG